MPAVTIRNISEETHKALKKRAFLNKRSTEAEIRAILDNATEQKPKGVGTLLFEFGQKHGGIELDIERDKTPIKPADYK